LWNVSLQAQSPCEGAINQIADPFCPGGFRQESTGDFFTLRYCGTDTFFVGNANCFVNLLVPGASLNINPVPATTNYNAMLTGFMTGDPIPAGQEVTMVYVVSNGTSATTDTLCFQLVFVDTIAPTITATLSDATVACDVADYIGWADAHKANLLGTSTDNCAVDSVYYSPATFTDNCGTQTTTFFVADVWGNVSTTTATYTTTDNTIPVFAGLPPAPALFLACDATIPPPAAVTATDNCDGVIVPVLTQNSSQTNDGTCTDASYTITRRWIATDVCSNADTFTQIINIEDLTPPSFDIPADTVINCNQNTDTTALGGITNIVDNCGSVNTVQFSENIIPGACPQERTIQRTWTVLDACLNQFGQTQIITVQDTTAPTAVFPPDTTLNCLSQAATPLTAGAPTNLSDNCDGSPSASHSDIQTTLVLDCEYTIQRTWTITDDCGNVSPPYVQTITVKDTVAPVIGNTAANLTVACDDAVDIDSLFNAWVASRASATATDNCVNQAALIWTANNSGTADPAVLPAPMCTPGVPGIYRRQTVDFIVADRCGNTAVTTATFTVRDDVAPVISQVPSDDTIPTDPGVCEAFVMLPLPMVTEECGNSSFTVNLFDSQVLTAPPGDPIETPVDDMVISLFVQGPPVTASGTGTLTISLLNVDAESPTEFFLAYGEDGTLLGQVAHTPVQCGDTTTTFSVDTDLLNDWAYDGVIQLVLKPNIPANLPGRFSVNPICPGGMVSTALEYPAVQPDHLKFEYRINDGPRIPVSPVAPVAEVLPKGENTIRYYFSDCAGNQDSCAYSILVEDMEAPQILCPPSSVIALGIDECETDVTVPLFSSVSDNCGVTTPTTQQQPADSMSALITYAYNPNLNDYVANDKVFVFSGLQGDATPGGVQLVIELQADVESVNEYFEIYDNDNNLLGTTQTNVVVPGDCDNPARAVFSIPANVFNDWASAGDIQVTARSFMNYPIPPAGPGWGINPCDPAMVMADGDSDGSYIYATFVYESVEPLFYASGATSIDTVSLTPPLDAPTYTLNQGVTTFTYEVTDLEGNTGTCSFDIDVQDVTPPVALCGPTFVDINPSGIVVDTLEPADIDLGSYDNCPNFTMEVIPNIINCNTASFNPVTVQLVVTDAAGNISTCNTFVNVTVTPPAPTVTSDCGSSTLQLNANAPVVPGSGTTPYQYTWFDPTGLSFAYTSNPVIQDANLSDVGFYNVVIEGLTGCSSVGVVQVTCDLLPLAKPGISALESAVCSAEQIKLSTTSVCGTTVQYKWYTGGGDLVGTTTAPSLTLAAPAAGTYEYYVVVERNSCDSDPSDPVSVTVFTTPVATPTVSNTVLCEGQTIQLYSLNNLPGSSCTWTGPCGYVSNNCSPAPITDITTCNSGNYELTVSKGVCVSEPATLMVTVVPKPETPQVTNSTSAVNPACVGDSVILSCNAITGATNYVWNSPAFTSFTTTAPVLVIPNADLDLHAGNWSVKAVGNPCESDNSLPTTVHVSPLPEAVTLAATPAQLCEGQSVQLSASSSLTGGTYQWQYPNGQTVVLQNPAIGSVDATYDGTYTLTVSSQFNCSVQATLDLDVIDRVDITGISSDVPTCATGPVNVQMVATLFPPDDGSYQYTWTGPGFASTGSAATIPNATFSNSGAYTLVVTNTAGCSSLPATLNIAVPQIIPTPQTPVPDLQGPLCEGDDITLTTNAYPGGASYIWTTTAAGGNTFVTSTPSLTLDDLTVADAGNYSVEYIVADCPSSTSGTYTLVVNPKPVALPVSNNPVCEGETIQFGMNCTTGATYEWSGPSAFSATVCNPIIANASAALHAGTYVARIRVNGCWSDPVAENVIVKPKPSVPVAVNQGPYCSDTDVVLLSVTNTSATPNATYTWFDTNGEPVGSAGPMLNFPLSDPTQFGDGNVEFYVVATLSGCSSSASVPTQVVLNTIPANLPDAGADMTVCQGAQIQLGATAPSVGTGLWSQVSGDPAGVVLANPNVSNSTVSGLTGGNTYAFQWTLSNGACENYASDTVQVMVMAEEVANAGEPFTACFTSISNLAAATPSMGTGLWTQPAAQASLGVAILDPSVPTTTITGLVPGNSYVFTWTVTTGCGSSTDAVLVTVSDEDAFAGTDFTVCGVEGLADMSATPAQSGVGIWTSPDNPDLSITTPGDPQTTVLNLVPGQNLLVWEINGGSCGEYSVDTVLVEYLVLEATDDQVAVPFAGQTTFDVTTNDVTGDAYEIFIFEPPLHGDLSVGTDGQLTYVADLPYVGADQAVYELCRENCECITATIFLQVGSDAKCVVPTIITPNQDGINDAFIVPCLSDRTVFPNSEVGIFNQWGDEVFRAKPYRNDWEGTYEGEDLPAGTYFYVVDLGNGDEPMAGYLIIQR
jgi:gliding motility-associated-like protein